jgi:hypothetical protein
MLLIQRIDPIGRNPRSPASDRFLPQIALTWPTLQVECLVVKMFDYCL